MSNDEAVEFLDHMMRGGWRWSIYPNATQDKVVVHLQRTIKDGKHEQHQSMENTLAEGVEKLVYLR